MTSQPTPDPDTRWSAVIAYGDAPAGRRAMHVLDNVAHAAGEESNLCPRLWRFDILEVTDWRAQATIDTLPADFLIISTSSKDDLPAGVQDWVRTCLHQKQGHAAVVVALLGPADETDALDSPRVQFLRKAAEAAGLGFFAPAPPAVKPAPVVAPNRAPSRPADRILLVEDDSKVRQFSAMVLFYGGYEVNAVEGSQAAWDALQSHRYDLLITDNQMSGMSGLELVRKLRSAQMALPVIMASGGISAEVLNQNQWLQPAMVLPKPFTSDALLRMVSVLLGRTGPALSTIRVSVPSPCESNPHWGLNE